MMGKKLRAVVRHEFFTIIRQPSFWISLIALPLLAGLIILIGALTDDGDKANLNDAKKLNIAVVDNSMVIDKAALASYNLKLVDSSRTSELQASVKSGKLDGLIIYPMNLLETGKYRLFADNTEKNNSDLVSSLGKTVLQQSLLVPIESKQVASLALTGGDGDMQSYANGKEKRDTSEIIVPGLFLILFYIVLIFSVGYALSSVAEEKENRSIEMVLSYIKPRTLILGKLLGVILVSLLQIFCILLIAVAAFIIVRALGNDISLPLEISDLSFAPAEILIGLAFLLIGFIFYVGLMATVGAIFPSSKEANSFSSVFFILPALPFWGVDAIINQSSSLFTQILTYFPLTAPTTALLRNAIGNLGTSEALLSLAILALSTGAIVVVAARAFRLGTLEYANRVKLSALVRR